MFRFEHLTVDGVRRPRLQDANGVIPADGITVVAGPSGSGKSTLLRCCNRLELPTDGRVLLWGDDVADQDPLRVRRRVGMVFQRPTPFPGTVRDNLQVAEPSITDAHAISVLGQMGLDPS